MIINRKEQEQLIHAQKLFYALYGKLPTEDMYYQYWLSKQNMDGQRNTLNIDSEVEAAVSKSLKKLIPKQINLDISKQFKN